VLSETIHQHGCHLFAQVVRLGLEGIMAKRLDGRTCLATLPVMAQDQAEVYDQQSMKMTPDQTEDIPPPAVRGFNGATSV